MVVLDKVFDTAVVPCGHAQFCGPCMEEQREQRGVCPVCRGAVERTLRLYCASISRVSDRVDVWTCGHSDQAGYFRGGQLASSEVGSLCLIGPNI